MPKKVPQIRDYENLFERDTRGALVELNSRPFLDGRLVEDVDLTTSQTKVAHGLGRIPKGWVVVDKTGNVDVWRDTTGTSQRKTFLYLKADAAVTVSLWVF